MEKKSYETPEIEVIYLDEQPALLAYSPPPTVDGEEGA